MDIFLRQSCRVSVQIEIQQFQCGGISDSFRFPLVDHFLRLADGNALFQCFYSHVCLF